MSKKLNVLAASALCLSLAACMGSDPYTDLEVRMGRASVMANNTVAQAQESLRCPAGMVKVPKSHRVSLRNDTNVQYREEHGRDDGYRSGGRGRYATYNGSDVEVTAETNSTSQGEMECILQLDLTPAK
jgi:hypothetical protein